MVDFTPMESATARLEDAVNTVSDMDSGWWPFLFLRPTQEDRITNLRVAMLSVLYGVMGGMMANIALRVTGEGAREGAEAARVSFSTFPVLATIGFFVLYKLTFAYCWNRRADRLTPIAARIAQK
jgi:hypothetical protein